jgi:hypothetical protein
MKEEKKPVDATEEKKAEVDNDLEKRSKMFQVDLEISSKKYQVGLQPLIAPTGPIIQIIDQKEKK